MKGLIFLKKKKKKLLERSYNCFHLTLVYSRKLLDCSKSFGVVKMTLLFKKKIIDFRLLLKLLLNINLL